MIRTPKKIVIVEDDVMLQTVYSMFVTDMGHSLLGAFSTADEALRLCETTKPNVVLLDINLEKGMDGITSAHKFYLEYNIPIIFISSFTDDETVSQAISQAAYGYLVKPVDKVMMGITIDLVCWRHEFEQQRKISEQLIEYMQNAVITISLAGKVLFHNKASYQIFGLDENTDEPNFCIWIQKSDEYVQEEIIEVVLKSGYYINTYEINDNEQKKYIQISFSLLFDEINEVYAIAAFANDITQLMEFSLGFQKIGSVYTALLNGMNQMVLVFDKENQLIQFNPLASHFFEKKLQRLLMEHQSIHDVLYFLQKNEILSLQKNVFSGVYHNTERSFENNHEQIFLQLNWIPVTLNDRVENLLITITDVTSLRQLENDFEEQKTELKPIFDSSIQRFYLVDLQLNIIAFNKSAREVIYKEFDRPLKKGDSAMNLVPQEDRRKQFMEQFELAKQGHSVFYKESYPLKNEIHWNETHLDPVINDRGEIFRILIWTLDITDRERSLAELKESEERYALVAKGGNDGIFDWDMIHHTVYLSPRWKSLLGYEDYEIKNEFGTRDSLIHPDDIEKATNTLNDYLEGKIPVYENEFRLRHKKGDYIWVIERGELLRNEQGEKIRLAGSITDITRLKNTEQRLLNLNKTLLEERKMFMQGSVVITRIKADESKKFVYISENVKDVLGYAVEDFTLGRISYDELLHPDDIQLHIDERNKAIEIHNHQIPFSPYRMKKSNGDYIWVQDFSIIIENPEDQSKEILGYFIDITEQKRYEENIKEANKRYYTLFEEASDAIMLIDEIRIIDSNRHAEQLFGYSHEELLSMDIVMLSPETQPNQENSMERFSQKLQKSITDETKAFYWQFKNKDNTLIDTEIGLSPVIINNKRLFFQAIIRDISLRKKLERSLKESEHRNKALLEAIPDLLFIVDNNEKYVFFKPDRERKFDVPHETVIGKKLSDFFSGEVYDKFSTSIKKAKETNSVIFIEYDLLSPLGLRHYEARIAPLEDDQVLQVVRDLGPAN